MTWSIPTGPKRIVCLTEEPTEILYALGEQKRIVGISAYTVRPPNAKDNAPVVSAYISGSVSKISALKPDLIIGFSDIQAQLAKDLIAANLPVLIFNQRSIQEILDVIMNIGLLVGQQKKATQLVESYIQNLERAYECARFKPKISVYFEEWDAPMITAIKWVSELIEIAGGHNIFKDRSEGKLAKERFVTAEDVIERSPEVVMASWCGKSFDENAFISRPGFEALPAVQNGRLYEIPAEIILQPGPACLTDGLACIENILGRLTQSI